MTIEQLNERITQLTDLVSSASDTINNAKEMIKLAEQERDRLAEERREQEPKFERVKRREEYYTIGFSFNKGCIAFEDKEEGHRVDEARYNSNKYFHTKERAQEVADKINFLMKLERLHDTFCPDYFPDWNGNERKYFVFYHNRNKCYEVSTLVFTECKTDVFFPTQKIAQKICDILNAELESEK